MDPVTKRIADAFLAAMCMTGVVLIAAVGVQRRRLNRSDLVVYMCLMGYHVTSLAFYVLMSEKSTRPDRGLIAYLVGSLVILITLWVLILTENVGAQWIEFRNTHLVYLALCGILELLHYFTFHAREAPEEEPNNNMPPPDPPRRRAATSPLEGRYSIKKTIDVEKGEEVLVLYYNIHETSVSKGLVKTRILKEGEKLSDVCAICMADVEPGESIVTCQCLKSFHTSCILDWADSCPTCMRRGYLIDPEVIDA